MDISLPSKLKTILFTLIKHNIKPIIVGGFIRDTLLGKQSKDIDIEVYNIPSYEELITILSPFGKVNIVGKSFGVCKMVVDGFEVDFSLPREENKIALGHKGFKISLNSSLDFCQASKRRDFTINAMGYDIQTNTLLDCYGGKEDLEKKILRYIDKDKFQEDPLRVFRAIGFATRFDFELDVELFFTIEKMIQSKVLLELPKERIYTELEKLFLKSSKPSKGLVLIRKLKEVTYFQEIVSLDEVTFFSYIQAFDRVKEKNILYYMSLLALYIDINRFSNDKKLLNDIDLILKHYKEVKKFIDYGWSDFDIKWFATKISWKKILPFVETLYPNDPWEKLKKSIIENGVYEKPIPPKVTGKDLIAQGLQPSKEFKKILQELYIKQLQEEKS